MATSIDHRGDARLLTVSYQHQGTAKTACLEVTKAGGVRVVSCDTRRTRLGDAIATATKAVGIKPCAGCRKRQAALNRWTPSWLSRLLGRLRAQTALPARCGKCGGGNRVQDANPPSQRS